MAAKDYIIRGLVTAAILIASATFAADRQQTVAPQAAPAQSAASNPAAPTEDRRSAKQKLLDEQADKLVTMAGELKVAVDKTNKNILSLDVVRKAEDIEALAHKMKEQGKK